MKFHIYISIFLILVFSFVSYGQTTINVPGDLPTIQAAIDSASAGDTVLVADGTYYENINFKGKAITVASHLIIDSDTSHIRNTIIDGSQPANPDTASVVFFVSGEDTTSVFYGFTITGGSGTLLIDPGVEKILGGGGIVLENSGAKILYNRITGNNLLMDLPGPEMRLAAGAAIAAITTDPHKLIIKNNLIYYNNSLSNVSDAFGGGIVVTENVAGAYDVIISDNEFIYNVAGTDGDFQAAGGGIVGIVGKITITNNKVMYNTTSSAAVSIGAGVVLSETLSGSNSIIKNNYISYNLVDRGFGIGGGIVLVAASSVNIESNHVEANAASLGGGLFISQSDALVQSNIIKNNSSDFGGGMFVELSTPLINKNLIAGNTAELGGGGIEIEVSPLRGMQSQIKVEDRKGSFTSNVFSETVNNTLSITREQLRNGNFKDGLIQDESAGALEIRNNTIVNNTSNGSMGGAGIASLISTVNVVNSIIGGNQPTDTQIQGPVYATYSNIEGGYEGMGNIDLDPLFVDEVNYYLDPTNSPCIDAGNPDLIFNDPGDPMNPGYALWPALGTLRNDMGAYGGNTEAGDQQELLGPLFNAFVERVNAAQQQDKQAIVDSFLSAAPSFPFVEENTIAYYIYTGTVGSVSVPGDANEWNPNAFPMMTQLAGTTLWYRQAVFESEARLDYKFLLNGTDWILDPRNLNTVTGGFGPNSELAMPAYIQPPEIEFNPGIPHGTLHTFLFTSDTLNNQRNIRVYTPPGYDSHPNYYYPVVLFHDGLEYISLGSAVNILDNLLAESKMNPVIAVFVPPVNRNEEYAFSQTQQFEYFIVNELMPHIDATFRTHTTPDKRAMLGPSFGGLITTQICYNNPDEFGLAAPYSPAYWPNGMAVMNMVLNGSKANIKWYIDWGTYDIGIMIDGRRMRDGLVSNGYELIWREWFEGHSWGSWRAHLDDALVYFFPKTVDIADEESVPTEYVLSQNYPNPFNPSTNIKYSIPESGIVTIKLYDIIGNEVATLINEEKSTGRYEVHFNANNLASGVYFYQISAGAYIETKKMILLR